MGPAALLDGALATRQPLGQPESVGQVAQQSGGGVAHHTPAAVGDLHRWPASSRLHHRSALRVRVVCTVSTRSFPYQEGRFRARPGQHRAATEQSGLVSRYGCSSG
jgi:hypothetical protein